MAPVLGKNQALIGYLMYQFSYLVFYVVLGHIMYVIFNFDYMTLLMYAIVSLLQSQVKRNQKYVDFLNHTIQFRKGLKSTQIIYEEEMPNN